MKSSASLVVAFVDRLSEALRELKAETALPELEKWATLIVQCMGNEARDYHRPEHALTLTQDAPPHLVLAGLFHDLIYLQVDSHWNSGLNPYVGHFQPNSNGVLNVVQCLSQNPSPIQKAVVSIFGFERHETLSPAQGLNELLSALVAATALQERLNPVDLLQIITLIEVTQFHPVQRRTRDQQIDHLNQCWRRAGKELGLQIKDLTPSAEVFSNCQEMISRDLSSFWDPDFTHFVSQTWSVMSETSPELRNRFFMVSDYSRALYSTTNFLGMIRPETLYWNPRTEQTKTAATNLSRGSEYLRLATVSISVVEALSILTGGDAPYEFWVGPMKRAREQSVNSLDDHLPAPAVPPPDRDSEIIWKTLKFGRKLRSRFDQKNQPLAAFLFAGMQYQLPDAMWALTEQFHQTKTPELAIQLIRSIPVKIRIAILEAFGKIARPRADSLLKLTPHLI